MGWRTVACVVGVVPLSGCITLTRTAIHNFVYENKLQHGDEHLEHQFRAEARDHLRLACQQHPRKSFTHEFRDGFADGYVDYLMNGGPAHPPAVAPARYRTPKFLTPEGHAKVHDYMLGFKYGADVAVATGRRAYLTHPVLVGTEPSPPPPNIVVLPPPPDGLSTDPPTPAGPPAAESAPLPKPVPLPDVPKPDAAKPNVPMPNVPVPDVPKPDGGKK